jgi:hypothetical protein
MIDKGYIENAINRLESIKSELVNVYDIVLIDHKIKELKRVILFWECGLL